MYIVPPKAEHLLSKVSAAELFDFIREKCIHDQAFLNSFHSYFAYLDQEEDIAIYKQQLQQILHRWMDKSGYIDGRVVTNVGMEVGELLLIAKSHFEHKRYKSLMLICMAIMEELVPAFQYTDDSGDDLGSSIKEAVEFLTQLTTVSLPEADRQRLLTLCSGAFANKVFMNWDWHWDMIALAAKLIKNREEATELTILLEREPFSPSDVECIQSLKESLSILCSYPASKEK